MPELPEVQTMVDDLIEAGLPGTVIHDVQVFWDRTIAKCTVKTFRQKIKGRKIIRLFRRAKYMVFVLEGNLSLIVHLRMTGRFVIKTEDHRAGRHIHVVLSLDDHRQLLYHDTRKFGRFYLTESQADILGGLGPEPLEDRFSAKVLAHRLECRRRQIKPLLLDQGFIAGIGNIYADEALWRARIHPQRLANTLNRDEIISIHRSIRFVLRQGIRNGGTTLGRGKGNFHSARRGRGRNATELNVFRRTGSPCPRCSQAIEKIVVAQRATHYCGSCQKLVVE